MSYLSMSGFDLGTLVRLLLSYNPQDCNLQGVCTDTYAIIKGQALVNNEEAPDTVIDSLSS